MAAVLLIAGIILGMGSANERRRYYVTHSLIARAYTQNDPEQRLTKVALNFGMRMWLKP